MTMRKSILLMITAAAVCLAACNGSDKNASSTSQPAASQSAAAPAAAQPQQQTGVSPMQPTGDIDKDAKDLDQQLKAAMEDPSKTNDINAMMKLYADYYKKQGKVDEFQQKLTEATKERLNADMKASK